uniref:uncharacterized protein DDB_G0271670-like n=1 Tax=Erigeron canadensis TaxID=72917 RepID=UPI001CB89893|nr:uncharacterized protein DDB_G0271670-like [Erigeron canadensis]
MAITHVLLQSNFNSNIQQWFPTNWSYDNGHLSRINYSCRYNVVVTASLPRTRMKCVAMNHHKTLDVENDSALRNIDTGCDINEDFWRSVEDFFKALQKPVITGVMILLSLIFCFDQQRDALAATGGRMGGRSFSSSSSSGSSSRSSSSSSSSSRSYSSPSSSSSSSTRSSSPKSSASESYNAPSSSSSSSYSSTKSSSPKSSYSDESYSRPRSYSSRSYSSPKSSNSVNYNTQVGTVPSEKAKKLERKDVFWIVTVVSIICLIVYLGTRPDSVQDTAKSSVIKLQVGLLGTARSLQKDLDKIAETADTSNPKGLSNILKETTAALLRHSGYCISSYSSVDVKRGATESEKRFNQLSIEERNKFDKETLVNVDNIKKQTVSSSTSNEACSEYIVVTIIVAAKGILYLPPIKSDAELKKALQKLASISSSNIMAAEVLWTPQEENDCLTEKEMLEDYPQLRPL